MGIRFTLTWMLCLVLRLVAAQVSIQNLYFNSTSNIIRLNFEQAMPNVVYTGIGSGASIGEGIAHAEDKQGNIIIWVNAKGVYDKNGTLMPGSTGILADPSSTEIVICPFPSDTLKYYIFYNQELYSPLNYSVVDLRLRGGLGDISQLNQSLDGGHRYAEGLEVVRIPCSSHYWLLAYQQNKGFVRFKIDDIGIGAATLFHPFVTSDNNGRGELEYHHGRFGFAITTLKKALIGDFDPVVGTAANTRELTFPNATNGMYGLEFSPDASKVYLTDFYNRDFFGKIAGPNLFRYDFLTGNTASWTIPYDDSKCARMDKSQVVEGLGQIELGKDGNLYIPHVFGCQITVIKQPNEVTPVLEQMDVNTILSHGVSDHIQSDFFKTLLTSASQTICEGDSVLLSVKGGSHHRWTPTTGLANASSDATYAKPKVSTTYTVYADNQYGCQDSTLVTVSVIPKVKPTIREGNQIICGNASVRLTTVGGQTAYLWSRNGVVISSTQADSLRTNLLGQYAVSMTNANGCRETTATVTVREGHVAETSITASGQTRLCKGETVKLSTQDVDGYGYQWYRNNGLLRGQQQPELTVSESGTYQVVVKNQDGCETRSAGQAVEVFDMPAVELGPDRVTCAGEAVTLSIGNQDSVATYQWSDGSKKPTLQVTESGEYQITVHNGPCSATQRVKVTFLDEKNAQIPNVVTPNGDAHNECFVLPAVLGKVGIAIYNRWGKEVYQNQDYRGEWNAEGLATGLYYYYLYNEVPCFNPRKGWLHVLR